jgi:hypothetical protein
VKRPGGDIVIASIHWGTNGAMTCPSRTFISLIERIDLAPGAVHSEPALRLASGY